MAMQRLYTQCGFRSFTFPASTQEMIFFGLGTNDQLKSPAVRVRWTTKNEVHIQSQARDEDDKEPFLKLLNEVLQPEKPITEIHIFTNINNDDYMSPADFHMRLEDLGFKRIDDNRIDDFV